MCVVTLNLLNDSRDKTRLLSRSDLMNYKAWAVSRKIRLSPNSDSLFDTDCISITSSIFEDWIAVGVDEKNAEINMDDYPEMMGFEHKESNPGVSAGHRLFTFYVYEPEDLTNFVMLLDKSKTI